MRRWLVNWRINGSIPVYIQATISSILGTYLIRYKFIFPSYTLHSLHTPTFLLLVSSPSCAPLDLVTHFTSQAPLLTLSLTSLLRLPSCRQLVKLGVQDYGRHAHMRMRIQVPTISRH
jgi:hypothetical protein